MSKDDEVTVRLVVDTGYPSAGHDDEIIMSRGEWERMSDDDRYKLAVEFMWEHVDCYAELVEDD